MLIGAPSADMPVGASELFEEYETDLDRLLGDVATRLQSAAQASDGRSAQNLVAEATKMCSGADQALKQMEMEANSLPPPTRSTLEPIIRERKAVLAERRKAVEEARQDADRRVLLCSSDADGPLGKSARDRERLLDADQKLNESSSRLEQARRQALETEQIGIDVLSDLHQQREVILRTRANVGEIGAQLGNARRMIDSMARRAAANRRIATAVMVFMLVMVAFAAYFIMGGSLSGSSEPHTPASSASTASPKAPTSDGSATVSR